MGRGRARGRGIGRGKAGKSWRGSGGNEGILIAASRPVNKNVSTGAVIRGT